MKPILLTLTLACLCSCAGPGTSEQVAARGKNLAKLEKRAWNIGGFLANLAGNIIVNTATNYANEHLDQSFRRQK